MNKVWVTRSQPRAQRSGEMLKRLGFNPFVYPLLQITPALTPVPQVPKNAILIFTSGHGVRAFSSVTSERGHRVITVGDATAELARSFGFSDVNSAGGNASDIVKLVSKDYAGEAPSFVHISGETVRGDIVSHLQLLGFRADRHIYYRSEAVIIPPEEDLSHLRYVLLYSPKGAESFVNLAVDVGDAVIVSISKATDAQLGGNENTRLIATAPTEKSMLSLLD